MDSWCQTAGQALLQYPTAGKRMTVCLTRASFTSKSITLSISSILMTLVFRCKYRTFVAGRPRRHSALRTLYKELGRVFSQIYFQTKIPPTTAIVFTRFFSQLSQNYIRRQASSRKLTPLSFGNWLLCPSTVFFTVGFVLVFWAAIVFCVIYQALADDNVYVFAAHWGISEAVTNFESSQLNVVPATHSSCGLHLWENTLQLSLKWWISRNYWNWNFDAIVITSEGFRLLRDVTLSDYAHCVSRESLFTKYDNSLQYARRRHSWHRFCFGWLQSGWVSQTQWLLVWGSNHAHHYYMPSKQKQWRYWWVVRMSTKITLQSVRSIS